MLNFYRRFIPHAAQTQALLSEFLKGSKKNDKSKISWSDQTIAAFKKSKQELANVAMLTQSKPNASLILQVDAMDYAIGGALNQNTAAGLEPLAFYSRKLNAAETKYSAYDRELLAVYAAIKHFRFKLEEHKFTIFTDHKPLTFAFKQKLDKYSRDKIDNLISFLSSQQTLNTQKAMKM
ncbi:transposon Ty3-I Gag-Pol polyprotein [Trichonephila clavipes]|nr:transposon Ty3-I Gag-Pol polyprotein [Trichonephila clavipes]